MTPSVSEVLRTVYLGDQACTGIRLDTWAGECAIRCSAIVRIGDPDRGLDWATDEVIENGELVFGGVDFFELDNGGMLPNDFIDEVTLVDEQETGATVRIVISCVVDRGDERQATLTLRCRSVAIRSP